MLIFRFQFTSIHESFETGHSKYATKGNSMSNLNRRPNYCGIFQDGMQQVGRICSSVVNSILEHGDNGLAGVTSGRVIRF